MTDMIKFKVIDSTEQEVKKAKRSGRLLFFSILIVLFIITIGVGLFLMIEREEDGIVVEQAPLVDTNMIKKQAEQKPVKKFVYIPPENKIKSSTIDDNMKSVSDMILKHREGWAVAVKEIADIDLSVSSITSFYSLALIFNASSDTFVNVDTLLAKLGAEENEKSLFELESSKIDSTGGELLLKCRIPVEDTIPEGLSLEKVPPFLRGRILSKIDSLANAEKLEVIENKPLGSQEYEWGTKYNAIIRVEGVVEDIADLLDIISTDEKMISIQSVAIEVQKPGDDPNPKAKCHGAIAYATYNVKGIAE